MGRKVHRRSQNGGAKLTTEEVEGLDEIVRFVARKLRGMDPHAGLVLQNQTFDGISLLVDQWSKRVASPSHQ